jgi:hypothetical protein
MRIDKPMGSWCGGLRVSRTDRELMARGYRDAAQSAHPKLVQLKWGAEPKLTTLSTR